jgi:hypothetical protein
MSKHTKGPWSYRLDDSDVWAGDVRVCRKPHNVSAYDKEWQANARLIAAAPDLLAALEDLLYQAEHSKEGSWDRDEARAAIAKAKGGEK